MLNATLITVGAILNGAVFTAPKIEDITDRAYCYEEPVCPSNDGQVCYGNGNPFLISCNSDFYGGDLKLAQTTTFTNCLAGCSKTQGCVGVSYEAYNCYMKQAVKIPASKQSVVAASQTATPYPVTTPAARKCQSQVSCGAFNNDDNCTFQSNQTNSKFTVRCNTDFYGNDIGNAILNDPFTTCISRCNSGCVAVSWQRNREFDVVGTCHLKGILAVAIYSDTVSGAYINPNAV